jgi:hypothetical protein
MVADAWPTAAILGGIAYLFILAMVATSFDRSASVARAARVEPAAHGRRLLDLDGLLRELRAACVHIAALRPVRAAPRRGARDPPVAATARAGADHTIQPGGTLMKLEGGCYCRAIRYQASGDALFKGQCHCRECQYISGGHPNVVIGMPEPGFAYTKGKAKAYRRSDLDNPVAREFCPECGTHILTRTPNLPAPCSSRSVRSTSRSSSARRRWFIFTVDKQSFHHVPEGVPTFERLPG